MKKYPVICKKYTGDRIFFIVMRSKEAAGGRLSGFVMPVGWL